MPTSSSDRFERVDAIFDAALDLPTTEQINYIERTCTEDPQLRHEVLELLRAHHHDGGILDRTLPRISNAYTRAEVAPMADEHIGPFKVIRPIGQGGMGQVYLGIRDDDQGIEQRVAIKLIRHPSEAVLRRFFEERRILAWLEHPRIARFIDAGITSDGMPYFAMEYVEGEPIDKYCANHHLTLDQRLALFEQVCEAVSYAHQHLVIHRDVKPGNILVTNDGQVKLLDFGIAKVLDPAGPDDRTRTGLRVMTPEVAAPEQVRGRPVSTATDVYALGVLLYQLISGRRPYDVRNVSPAEFERIVCEEIPIVPSAYAPDPIRKQADGDLDLIVMTALHKSESHRYKSPGQLALDLHRFRNGFAISARADTVGYRAATFVRRHRTAVLMGVAVVAGIIGAGLRERTLRKEAETAAQAAMEVQNFIVGVFDVSDPAITAEPGKVTARELLDRGAQRIDSSLTTSPDVRARMQTVLGRVYTNLGLYQQATPLLERARVEQTRLHGTRDTSVATATDLLGLALLRQDKLDDAERLLTESRQARRRKLGDDAPETAQSAEHLAMLYEARATFPQAESLYTEKMRVDRLAYGDSSVQVAGDLNNVGLIHYQQGHYEPAIAMYRQALAIQLPKLGERHATTAATMQNLGQTFDAVGNRDSAESYYRRSLTAKRAVLGDLHPSVTIGLNNLGQFLAGNPRTIAEGEALTREAMALDTKLFGPKHTYVAEGLRNLGTIARSRGDFRLADSAMRAALEIDRAVIGEQDVRVAFIYNSYGQIRQQMFDMPGAIRMLRASVTRYEALVGTGHRNTNVARINLARMLIEGGGSAIEAESLLTVALAHLDTTSGGNQTPFINARREMGEAKLAQGAVREALPLLRNALALSEKEFGEDSWRTANAKISLGRALLAAHRRKEAETYLRAADEVIQKNRLTQPWLAQMSANAMRTITP